MTAENQGSAERNADPTPKATPAASAAEGAPASR